MKRIYVFISQGQFLTKMIQANFQFKAKTHDELGHYQYLLELKIYFISKDRESNELGQTFFVNFKHVDQKV